MRATLVALLIGVLGSTLIMAVITGQQDAYGQRLGGAGIPTGDGLMTVPGPVVEGQQTLVVIDTHQRIMGTYQVDVASGQISLRCVRNFRWDLMMEEFNGSEPSPAKIQALLNSR